MIVDPQPIDVINKKPEDKPLLPEISWFTPSVGELNGYGYCAVNLIKGMQRNGLKVSYNSDHPLVHISFVQPEWYRGSPHQYKIGYTPWESTDIPSMWPHYMNQMQEIWTTSEFCKKIFERYDVSGRPIKIIPHGIDPEVWSIHERTVAGPFTFLHVGGPTERKGAQKVVEAFLEAFPGNSEARLILKSHGPTEARWIDHEKDIYYGSAANHPRIDQVDISLPEMELVSLYQNCHVMVYPTNGEGFGMIPFQAIATGMPTIVTNATGCKDFAHYSMPLDSEPAKGEGIHLGQWVEPNQEHLVYLMRKAYDNWEEEKKKALKSAHIIHDTQTWDHIARLVLNELGNKINERV